LRAALCWWPGLQDSAKALFRRGTARSHLGELEEARADLVAACKLAPADKGIREE
jgi:hypothetical protein